MSRLDVSKLAPPTEEFMICMIVFREACEEFGRYSMEAGVAMGMALEHAAPEIRQKMIADAHELGLVPPSLRFGPDGEPMYTAQDLGAFYCMDPQAVRATTAAALTPWLGEHPAKGFAQ